MGLLKPFGFSGGSCLSHRGLTRVASKVFLPSAHYPLIERDEIGPFAGIPHQGTPSLYPRLDALHGDHASAQSLYLPEGREEGQNGRKPDPVLNKYSFLKSQQIQITEDLKGNTKHKALSSKQIQSTNDQMPKTFKI